jgi:DNA-binding LacI/PurR family transcriptional regulator
MAQPAKEFGRIGATFLLERILQPDLAVRSTVLAPSLIVRQSCGAGILDKKQRRK